MQGPYAAEQEYFRLNWLKFMDKDTGLIPAPSLSLHLFLVCFPYTCSISFQGFTACKVKVLLTDVTYQCYLTLSLMN